MWCGVVWCGVVWCTIVYLRAGPAEKRIELPDVVPRDPLQIRTCKSEARALTHQCTAMHMFFKSKHFENLTRSRRDIYPRKLKRKIFGGADILE